MSAERRENIGKFEGVEQMELVPFLGEERTHFRGRMCVIITGFDRGVSLRGGAKY